MRSLSFLAVLFGLLAPPASAADAEQLLRQGRLVEALDAAAVAVEENPEDLDAQELAIDVFLTLGQVERAVSHARSRVDVAPDQADSHYLLGRAQVDPVASRAAYEQALSIDKSHARAHMGLGGLDEATGDRASARRAYLRATQLDATLTEAWVGLARIQLTEGARDEAQKTALAGFQRTSAPDLALMLATLDPTQAERVLSRALKASGSSIALHNAMARTALLAGKASLARTHAQQALVLDPSAVDARAAFHWSRDLERGTVSASVLGTLLSPATTGPDLEAAQDRAVTSSPRSAMVRFQRAMARQAVGDGRFLDDLVAATERDRDNDLVAEVAGDALLTAGRPADAIEPLTRAVGARPWDRYAAVSLARALRGAGYKGDAALLLERVATSHPKDIDVQLLYAQTLLEVGREPEAYAVIKVAMVNTGDPRLVAAFIKIAPAVGRPGEAARVLAPIAERSDNPALREAVAKLRAMAE